MFVGRGGGDADFSSSQFCFSTTDWQAFCGFALRSRAAESSFPIPGLETAKPPKMTSVGLTWLSVSRLSTCAEKGGGDGGRQAPKKVKDAVGALLLWLRRKTAEPAPCMILTVHGEKISMAFRHSGPYTLGPVP